MKTFFALIAAACCLANYSWAEVIVEDPPIIREPVIEEKVRVRDPVIVEDDEVRVVRPHHHRHYEVEEEVVR